jgi:uncharacterized membrane protein
MALVRRFFYPGLLTIVLLAFFLRVFQIAAPSYWLDEFVTVNFSTFPRWSALFWDNHPPLYYLLMKGWIALFGPWELATRSFSLIFSLATTATLGLWGRKLKDERLGLLLAFLSLCQPLTFIYAREARMYAMFEFFATLQLWMFWELYHDSKKWRGFLISSLFLSLTHYFALPLLLVEGALLAAWKKGPKSSRLRRPGLWVLSLCVAVLAIFFFNQFSWMHLEWQKLKFQMEPSSRFPTETISLLGWGSWCSVLAAGLIAALAFKKNEAVKIFSTVFLAVFFLSLCLAWAASRAIFLPRYFIFLTPVVITATGFGLFDLFRRPRKWPALTLSLLLLVGIGLRAPVIYNNNKTPWRRAAQLIWQTPDSVVYTTRTLAIRSPYFESRKIPVLRLEPAPEDLRQINQSLDEGKQVWIVENYFGALTYFNDLRNSLLREYLQVDDFTLTDGENQDPVLVYHVRRPDLPKLPEHRKNAPADIKTSAKKMKGVSPRLHTMTPKPVRSGK